MPLKSGTRAGFRMSNFRKSIIKIKNFQKKHVLENIYRINLFWLENSGTNINQ